MVISTAPAVAFLPAVRLPVCSLWRGLGHDIGINSLGDGQPGTVLRPGWESSPRLGSALESSLVDRGFGSSEDTSKAPVEMLETMDDYLEMLAAHPDKLVVVKVFAGFCRACKAFDVKYRRMSIEYADDDIHFCEMDWMKNRELCKSLQVKKLPHIEIYAGEKGRLEGFTCGPSKAGELREKLDKHLVALKAETGGRVGDGGRVEPPVPEFTDIRALYGEKSMDGVPVVVEEVTNSGDSGGEVGGKGGGGGVGVGL